MASALRLATPALRPGLSPPAVIAHAANRPGQAAAAAEAGADYVEVDLWVHEGALEVRHERRFPLHVPLLFEKWYFSRLPREATATAELAAVTASGAGLFLDLKNGGVRAGPLIGSLLQSCAPGARVAASSQSWLSLRPLARLCPAVDLFYSIDVPAKLDLFFTVLERDGLPRGVSCRESLLTPAVIDRLHQARMAVVAWTVDDEARARELAALGVAAITTHRVAEFSTIFAREAAWT